MVYIPTDLLVEILRRLPWTSRRRLRLVCRTWRDLVHHRTTEMQQCRDAAPLVVTTEAVYLLHDLDSYCGCKPRELWRGAPYKHMEVVGVSNGVLCLCDDAKPGGAITLANPATRDVLELPPIPRAGLFRRHNTRGSGTSWHLAYSFGYHHATGLYKVVHVPCFFKTKDTLHVFTLGENSWREIPAPSAKCKLESGPVCVNRATYWVTDSEGWERIMSFDHETEHVTYVKPLPASARARPICHLSEVQRRLGIAIATGDESCRARRGRGYGSIEVWILECTRKHQTWIHQYSLRYLPLPELSIQLTCPNFVHGEYVLMVGGQGKKLLRYHQNQQQSKSCGTRLESTAVHVKNCSEMTATSNMRGDVRRTFAYIKNTDALSVYKRW